MVVDQHTALRYRDEKAELDENQEDRDKDAASGKRGAPLLVSQYAPSDLERHELAILKTMASSVYRIARQGRRDCRVFKDRDIARASSDPHLETRLAMREADTRPCKSGRRTVKRIYCSL